MDKEPNPQPEPKPEPKPDPKPEPKPEPKPDPKPDPKPEPEPEPKKLDPKRVQKWAELAHDDPEAAEILRKALVGDELDKLKKTISEERSARIKAELLAQYGIPAEYAGLVKGSSDQELAEAAKAVGELVKARGGGDTGKKPKSSDPLDGYDPQTKQSENDFFKQKFLEAAKAEQAAS